MDSIKEFVESKLNEPPYHPLAFFAESVALTRQEPGVSIRDIAKCFKKQFDKEELKSLLIELQFNECPECEVIYKVGDDARVDMGMKCGQCAYGAEMYQEAKRLTQEGGADYPPIDDKEQYA